MNLKKDAADYGADGMACHRGVSYLMYTSTSWLTPSAKKRQNKLKKTLDNDDRYYIMLRSVVIDNDMLRYLAKRINKHIEDGGKIDRSFLSNAIWDYEKGKQ